MLAHALFCGCTLLVHAGQASTDLDRALALIPEEAAALAVVPDLDLLNDDLGALIDATNQPASVLAGRPIEMFKAAVGFGAEFDEAGSMVAWLQPDPASPGETSPLVMVPTLDPARFLESNFTPEGAGWRTGDEMLVFAKECSGHVLLGTDRGMVESYAPGQGSAKRVRARLTEGQLALFAEADLLLWADRRFLDTMSELAAETSQGIPVRSLGFSPPREGLPPAIEQAFEASTVLVNFDPLGFSMRSFTVFDPETEFGRLLEGGDHATTPLGRLPLAPFYLAMSVDVAGLGGMSNLQRISGLLGMDPPFGGSWFEDPALRIDSLQGAVYPSRLGIALGGFLNDSSLVVTGPDPAALEARFRSELEAMDGERDGVRYETIWTEDKPLRTGGVSDAFQIKETVLPPSQRSKQSLGRSAIERMFMQTMFGSRGLAGFAGTEGDAFVLTFSQRPDVWNRALAAAGGGTSLEEDPVLSSMRSWLMAAPDVEIAVGFGSLGKLLGQLARSLPGIEPDRMPQIPEGTPPVVLNFGHERGIAEMALLVPSGVIEVGVEQFIRDYSHLRGYGRTPAPGGTDPDDG